jgi:hypothetical protein
VLRFLLAGFMAAIFAVVVYVVEHGILTMSSDESRGKFLFTMLSRAGIIGWAALAVGLTVDLSIFTGPVRERIRAQYVLDVIPQHLGTLHQLVAALNDEGTFSPKIQDGLRAITTAHDQTSVAKSAAKESAERLDRATQVATTAEFRLESAKQGVDAAARRVRTLVAGRAGGTSSESDLADARKNLQAWYLKREQERAALAAANADVARFRAANTRDETALTADEESEDKAKNVHQSERSALVDDLQRKLQSEVQAAREQPLCRGVSDGSSSDICGFPARAKALWGVLAGTPLELPGSLKRDLETVRKVFPGEIAETEAAPHPESVYQFFQIGALFFAMAVPLMGIVFKLSIGQDLKNYYSESKQQKNKKANLRPFRPNGSVHPPL